MLKKPELKTDLKRKARHIHPTKRGKRTFAQSSDLNSGTDHFEGFGCFFCEEVVRSYKKVYGVTPAAHSTNQCRAAAQPPQTPAKLERK